MTREVSENAYHGLAPGLVPRTHDKDQHIDHKCLDHKYDMKGNRVRSCSDLVQSIARVLLPLGFDFGVMLHDHKFGPFVCRSVVSRCGY